MALQVTAPQGEPGKPPEAVHELRRYDVNTFDRTAISEGVTLPLVDEPFVPCWEDWVREAAGSGAFEVLSRYLPQLRFPIRAGMSSEDDYRAAVGRGVDPEGLDAATGLDIAQPEAIEIEIHDGCACRVPVVTARRRQEFEVLVRALARRNEPAPVTGEQGAMMVAGYNNWERIRQLRVAWEVLPPARREVSTWSEEFARIRPRRELYQDRFILVSDGPYSAVSARELGLDPGQWREMSRIIRCEHECTHYLTRRLLGSMRNHMLDELIADYAGLVAATGRYRADWFLRFLGISEGGRDGGPRRLDLYRGDPPLSAPATALLCDLARAAAKNVESFDRATWPGEPRSDADRARMVFTLASFRLEALAAPAAARMLEEEFAKVSERIRFEARAPAGEAL